MKTNQFTVMRGNVTAHLTALCSRQKKCCRLKGKRKLESETVKKN